MQYRGIPYKSRPEWPQSQYILRSLTITVKLPQPLKMSRQTSISRLPSKAMINIKQTYTAENMPSQQHIMEVLATITANTAGRNQLPEAAPVFPPHLPAYLLDTEVADATSIGLTSEDLDPTKPLRQPNLQRLLLAAQINHYRALGLGPPMQFRSYAVMNKFDPRAPEMERGKYVMTSSAIDPIKIITSSFHNREIIQDKANNIGIPIIPAETHANNCDCQELYMHNNYETLQPVRMCVPKEMYKAYPENSKWPNCFEMGFAAPIHKNISDVYFSEVSKAGTILPQLTRRCPVSQLIRTKPVLKKPQYAEININKSDTLAAAIFAQLERMEILQFTKFFNENPGSEDEFHITRFPHVPRILQSNIDTSSYGKEITSMEDIMINEPLVDAFYGIQVCEFCPLHMNIRAETDYLTHLLEDHAILLKAHFTCPGCLLMNTYTVDNYCSHYNHTHARTTGLMYVLNETNVHVRMQHAHILNMYMSMAQHLGLTADTEGPDTYVSAIGGYTLKDPASLLMEIMEKQFSILPKEIPKIQPRSSRDEDDHDAMSSWTTVMKRGRTRQPAAKPPTPKPQATYSHSTRPYNQLHSHNPPPQEDDRYLPTASYHVQQAVMDQRPAKDFMRKYRMPSNPWPSLTEATGIQDRKDCTLSPKPATSNQQEES